MSEQDSDWERKLVTKLAESSLQEQKKARRWGIFFKGLTFAYLITLLVMIGDSEISSTKLASKHTALVDEISESPTITSRAMR